MKEYRAADREVFTNLDKSIVWKLKNQYVQ